MMRVIRPFALLFLGLSFACSPQSSKNPRANAREITELPGDTVFYLNDHHGSPVVTLDSKGNVVEERAYHAYGSEHEPASTLEPWAFAGNELDATLLGDFHARPYDARLGRFLAVDPEPLFHPNAHLNPIAFQAYTYAAGDPVNLEDPTGRSVWTKLFKFGVRLVKTGDAAQSLYGMFDDAVTLFDASASITDRVVAGVSLASELAPISIGDVKDAGKALGSLADAGKRADKVADRTDDARRITVSRSRHPESAGHIADAQSAGMPAQLTVDRSGARSRRAAALRGTESKSGLDRDEYPPAMFREGGQGASVRSIASSDNRGAGACIGAQCRGLNDGDRVQIDVVD